MVSERLPKAMCKTARNCRALASSGNTTASGDPAMTIKNLRLFGRVLVPTRIVRSAIAAELK
jgi:hypothetical protein